MSIFRDLIDLPRIVIPYLLRPLTAAEVFLPHARPVSWFTQSNGFLPERDLPSLKDKVILVTGGNGGLGKESIYQLALAGPAKIYLAARSPTKGKAAIRDVIERLDKNETSSGPRSVIEYIQLDLSDLQSVQNACRIVLSMEKRLDILMLNAGIMATPPSQSQSGHEMQLCTNHVGHFLLSILLLPLLERTAMQHEGVRVITVASEAHHIAPSDFLDMIEDHDRLASASPFTAYGVSKSANILFAAELARRCESKRITSVSLHPGIIFTDLYVPSSDSNFLVRFGLPPVARLVFDDVEHGALNQIWCAAGAKRDELVNGAYYTPVGRIRSCPLTNDKLAGERLWRWTTDQISIFLN